MVTLNYCFAIFMQKLKKRALKQILGKCRQKSRLRMNFLKILFQAIIFLAFIALATNVWADSSYDEDDIIVEETIIHQKPAPKKSKKVVTWKKTTPKVSVQPPVKVKGIPVSKTYATELQKSRQDAEIQTEQKIVEKLEANRLRDEQERFNRLFGSKNSKKTVVFNTPNKSHITSGMYSSARTSSKGGSTASYRRDRTYAGASAGQITNLRQQIVNLQSFGSFGAVFGAYDTSGLMMEGSFYYSTHQLSPQNNFFANQGMFGNQFLANNINFNNFNNLFFSTIRQLTSALSIKFTPFSGRFKPYIGISAMYNWWFYNHNTSFNNNLNFNCHMSYQFCANGFYRTHSIDIGLNVGVDLSLTHKVDLGFQVLVSTMNIYNNHNNVFYNQYYTNSPFFGLNAFNNVNALGGVNPITLESTNWVIAAVNVKFYF